MHLDATRIPSSDTFRQLIRAYRETGAKRVYVTEFDIDFSNFRGEETEKQALKVRAYGEMLRVALEENIDGFAMFGFTGAAAWHPDGLIFDQIYRPEAAYYAIISELLRYAQTKK